MRVDVKLDLELSENDFKRLTPEKFEKFLENKIQIRYSETDGSAIPTSRSIEKWCDENCTSMFHFVKGTYFIVHNIYFFSSSDALKFKLIWCGHEENPIS